MAQSSIVSPFRPHLALEYSGKVRTLHHSLRTLEQIKYFMLLKYKLEIHTSLCLQATKIHQRAFGNDHPITARSLELMATVYAEIGKTEYSGKHSVGTEGGTANTAIILK